MKVVNPKLFDNLESKNPNKFNLGSGSKPKKGFYSLDHLPLDGVNVVADLNEPLKSFPDDSIDYSYSSHVFEHIENFLQLLGEIHRITKKNGTIEIIVPHFSDVYGVSDPTHKRFFGL